MEAGHFTGGCRCGAIRYSLDTPTLPLAYACHCLDCQTWSGSAFSEAMFIRESALVMSGEAAVYEFASPSGHRSRHRLCPVCHTRLFNTNTGRPGLAVIRAGTLDDSQLLTLVAHIWVKRKQPWLVIPQGVATWPEAAPMKDFLSVLGL